MKVINTNEAPVAVKVVQANGKTAYVHVAPRGKVTLASGTTVDKNWLALATKITVVKD